MKRSLSAVVAVLALLVPASALAAKRQQTEVTVRNYNTVDESFGQWINFYGLVNSKAKKCVKHRRVTFWAKLPGKDKRLDRLPPVSVTQGVGYWGFVDNSWPSARYQVGRQFYAKAKKVRPNPDLVCRKDRSNLFAYEGPRERGDVPDVCPEDFPCPPQARQSG
jgi:hypothetical protein